MKTPLFTQDDFQALRFVIAVRDFTFILCPKSPWTCALDEYVDDTYKVILPIMHCNTYSHRWTALPILDSNISIFNCSDVDTAGPALSQVKTAFKRTIDLLKNDERMKDDEPFWPLAQLNHSLVDTPVINIVKRIFIDAMNADNYDIHHIIIPYKVTYDYVNDHPLTLNKIREAYKKFSKNVEVNGDDQFLIASKQAMFDEIHAGASCLRTIFLNAVHDRFTSAYERDNLLEAVRTGISNFAFNFDETIERSTIESTAKNRMKSLNPNNYNNTLYLSLDSLDKFFTTKEWENTLEAFKYLHNDPNFPDIRYYTRILFK